MQKIVFVCFLRLISIQQLTLRSLYGRYIDRRNLTEPRKPFEYLVGQNNKMLDMLQKMSLFEKISPHSRNYWAQYKFTLIRQKCDVLLKFSVLKKFESLQQFTSYNKLVKIQYKR